MTKISDEEALSLILWKEIRNEIARDVIKTGGKNLSPIKFDSPETEKSFKNADDKMAEKFEKHKKELGYDDQDRDKSS